MTRVVGQHVRRGGLDFLDERVGRVQPFVGLGKVADVQRRTQDHFTFKRVDLTKDGLQEGGFARAVGADQCSAVGAAQFNVIGLEERFVGPANKQVAGADDQVAGAALGTQTQVQLWRADVGQTQRAHTTLGFVYAERAGGGDKRNAVKLAPVGVEHGVHAKMLDSLHHACQAAQFSLGLLDILPRDVFLDVIQLFDEFFFFASKDFLAAFPALLALFQVMVVVAMIFFDARSRHFQDAGGDFVEKIAVMRDDDCCPFPSRLPTSRGKSRQVAFEPFDGGDVEVVGRFVE